MPIALPGTIARGGVRRYELGPTQNTFQGATAAAAATARDNYVAGLTANTWLDAYRNPSRVIRLQDPSGRLYAYYYAESVTAYSPGTPGTVTWVEAPIGGSNTSVVSDATLGGTGVAGDPLTVANPFTQAEEQKLAGLPDDALETVATDATITGTGVSGDPLAVANPYPPADASKLAGIESGATRDQTGQELVGRLVALPPTQRLPHSALRGLPAILDRATVTELAAIVYRAGTGINFTPSGSGESRRVSISTYSQGQIQDIIGSLIAGATTSGITAAYDTTTNTVSLTVTGGGGGLDGAQVDARIRTALINALATNTETGIDVSYKTSDNTIDFIVSAAGVKTLLEGLTGSARLSYGAIQGGPPTDAQANVKPDWDAAAGDAQEILNKPTVYDRNNIEDFVGGLLTAATVNGLTVRYDTAQNRLTLTVANQLPAVGTTGQAIVSDGTNWVAGDITGGGGGGGPLVATATLSAPEYIHLAADINLPVQAVGTQNAWGAWTDIYRYTATEARHLWYNAEVTARASWEATGGGDRAGIEYRLNHYNSAGVLQEALHSDVFGYVRTGDGSHDLLGEHQSKAISSAVVMANGDYILLQGRGTAQNPAAGRSVVVERVGTDITVQELIPTVRVTGGGGGGGGGGLDNAAVTTLFNQLLQAAIDNGEDNGLSVSYQSDNTIDFTITGANIVALLSGLTGAARLSYNDLKDRPTIPAGTDLALSGRDSTDFTITSSTGNVVELPAATRSEAGLQTAFDKAKLDGVESRATADQTPTEIKTAYESNADTNAFTDAEKSKLAGVGAGAQANVKPDWDAAESAAAGILNKPSIPTARTDAELRAAAVAAVQAGSGLTRTVSGSGAQQIVTLALGTPPGRMHELYSAIKSTSAFAASDFTNAATGNRVASGDRIAMDTWTTGTRYLALAIPADQPDLEHIYYVGDPFRQEYLGTSADSAADDRFFAKRASSIRISGSSYKLYVTTQPFELVFSGQSFMVS